VPFDQNDGVLKAHELCAVFSAYCLLQLTHKRASGDEVAAILASR